jgi:hypothetical protein
MENNDFEKRLRRLEHSVTTISIVLVIVIVLLLN